jgi:hypothetical protein
MPGRPRSLSPAGVAEVKATEVYNSAARAFWIVDNSTIHRGRRASIGSRAPRPTPVLVHLPGMRRAQPD